MTTTDKIQWKRCPRCGKVYPLTDAAGNLLPKEQLMFDRVRAPRYADGYRWRDRCKACHSADTSRRLVAKKQRPPSARPAGVLRNAEAAALAGVSISTIARAKRRGELPRPLTVAAVKAWAQRQRSVSPLAEVAPLVDAEHRRRDAVAAVLTRE